MNAIISILAVTWLLFTLGLADSIVLAIVGFVEDTLRWHWGLGCLRLILSLVVFPTVGFGMLLPVAFVCYLLGAPGLAA